jgi:hypothetical protein
MEAGTRRIRFTHQPDLTNLRTAKISTRKGVELVSRLLLRNVIARQREQRDEGTLDVALPRKGMLGRTTSAEN